MVDGRSSSMRGAGRARGFRVRSLRRLMTKIFLGVRGYNRSSIDDVLYLEGLETPKRRNRMGISDRQLLSVLPFDAKFSKLFGDVFSLQYLLFEDADLLPVCRYLIVRRDGCNFVLPFSRDFEGIITLAKQGFAVSRSDLANLFRGEEPLCVRPAANCLSNQELHVSFDEDGFLVNGDRFDEEEMSSLITSLGNEVFVCEEIGNTQDPLLYVSFARSADLPPFFLHASFVRSGCQGDWRERKKEVCAVDELELVSIVGSDILNRLRDIAASFPELEYLCFVLCRSDCGFKILQIDTGDDLTIFESMSPQLQEFLLQKLENAENLVSPKRFVEISRRWLWGKVASRFGFMDYMYRNWVRDLLRDAFDPRFSLRDKFWAHSRGFLSFRKEQYQLTEDNAGRFLSDRDYRWLRPLNNVYRKWLWDKVSLRYSLGRWSEYLPIYYFHVAMREGALLPLAMDGCPPSFRLGGFDGIVLLLERNGLLAMKPVVGSHGEGFHKLEGLDGAYKIDGVEVSLVELKVFLESRSEEYVLTEYVRAHEDLERLWPNAVPTVRMMVINENGDAPFLANAYLRIGTSSSGYTDNIGSGGLFAYVDLETGFYHDAECLSRHVYSACPLHPDTGIKVEGFLPHWEVVKSRILEISRYIAPLEYLGFDVAITDHGFVVLEINTHQDLHRYPAYGPEVHGYFSRKVEMKRVGKALV